MSHAKRIPSGRAAPDFRRRNNQREPYDRVLIVCEGSTEKYYFEGLVSLLGLSSANIRINPSGNRTDPIQVVRYGIKLAKESHSAGDTYQRLYCVFDLDRPHQDALDLADNTNLPKTTLHLATSNPCFEIWLRLHFGYTDKSFSAVGNKTACQTVEDDLLTHEPHYSKGNAVLFGHLYPKVEVTAAMAQERPDLKKYVGQKLTVIAWLWARTVKSPNPAFANVDVPLASTFMLSTKVGKEAYVEPIIESGSYRFMVKMGKPKDAERTQSGTSAGKRKAFLCLISGVPIAYEYIRAEGMAKRMGTRLLAIVAEGDRGRIYLSPTTEMEAFAHKAEPEWKPDCEMPRKHRNFQPPVYGMGNLGDIFTARQLVALTTLSNLVADVHERVKQDALDAGQPDDGMCLDKLGTGATAYADAIACYLGLAVSRTANTINALVVWSQSREQSVNLFSRQAIPMGWDFPEVNPFAGAAGDFGATTTSIGKTISNALSNPAWVVQADAQTQDISRLKVVSTDPPYYDNVAYADLSDFFYVWLRRALKPVFPDLFATLAVPKAEELVAMQHRHGNKEKAEAFFLDGMTQAMHRLSIPISDILAFESSGYASQSELVKYF